MHRGSFDFDVFVAGGGPAGLATAIAAAQKGLRVAVADCAEPPVDKACGEGIMPSGVSALGELGVRLPDNGSAKLRGIRFTDAAGEVSAQFNVGFGAGIRRLALHTALVSRALTCGVDLRWRARLEHVTGHEAIVEGQSFRYRYLVGADGQNSRVRESSSFASETVIRRRFGFRRHYALQPWSEYVEVYWSDCGQMYVTPTSANEVCIALLTRDQRLRFDEALPQFPALCECLSGQSIHKFRYSGVSSSMWIVALALRRPYTFIVMALVIILLTPLTILRTPPTSFPTSIFPSYRWCGSTPACRPPTCPTAS
jgi:2-polyprenyl-6-methoxyphenol hydroxylase-like FAD-dependent oxidoreductase